MLEAEWLPGPLMTGSAQISEKSISVDSSRVAAVLFSVRSLDASRTMGVVVAVVVITIVVVVVVVSTEVVVAQSEKFRSNRSARTLGFRAGWATVVLGLNSRSIKGVGGRGGGDTGTIGVTTAEVLRAEGEEEEEEDKEERGGVVGEPVAES